MAEAHYKSSRTNPRFSFFAEAEVTLATERAFAGNLLN